MTLVTKISPANYALVIKILVESILSNDEEKHDIAVLTLRTIIDEIAAAPSLAGALVSEATPFIVSQLRSTTATQMQHNDAFDVLNTMLLQLPLSIVQFPELHQEVLETLLSSLLSPRNATSKRAVTGIGNYSGVASPEVYAMIVSRVQEILTFPPQTSAKLLHLRTVVQLVSILARNTPRSLRPDAPALIVNILNVLAATDGQEGEAEEVGESCLQALCALFGSCVVPGTVPLEPVVKTALSLLRHDPNYAGYDDDDDDFPDDDDELIMDNYSDDDDLSWKVRRSAAKLLSVLVSSHLSALGELLVPISTGIVAAVLDREETVRLEVLATFSSLLSQLQYDDADAFSENADSTSQKRKRSSDDVPMKLTGVRYVEPQLAAAVQNLCKQSESRSLPTRISSIEVLSQLVAVFGVSFVPYTEAVFAMLHGIFRGVNATGNVQGKSMRLTVVGLIDNMCIHVPAELPQELPFIVDVLVGTMTETNHRNALAGLRASALLVRCVFPLRLDAENDVAAHLQRIYEASVARLESEDSDQTLKDASIHSIDVLVSSAGDRLGERLNSALAIILERLSHEVTRNSCIAAIHDIVPSPRVRERAEVHRFGIESIQPLLALTHLADQTAVEASLSCLREIVATLRSRIPRETLNAIVQALEKNAQADSEAQYARLLLGIADQIVHTDASLGPALGHVFLPTIYMHLASPLLPAGLLEVLCSFLRTVGNTGDQFAFDAISSLLTVWGSICAKQGHKVDNHTAFLTHAPLAFAQCISAAAVSTAVVQVVLQRAVELLQGTTPDSVLGLYIIGSLGCHNALAQWGDAGNMFNTVLRINESNDERNRASAYALGGLVLSSPAQFIPRISALLQQGEVSTNLQGLLVVKEALANATGSQLGEIASSMWPRIFALSESFELNEGNQALFDVCYECIARMVFVDPATYLDALEKAAHSQTASVRALVLGAVRFTLTLDRMHTLDVVLSPNLWRFLLLLDDKNLTVSRLAVLALHSALYNRREIVAEHFGELIPKLLQHTVVREELKRKVAMGPFTVVIDDGLDLRKNTYEALFTLLETSNAAVDLRELVGHLLPALSDDDAIKLLVCLILLRIADMAPQVLTYYLEGISSALLGVMSRKVRDNATKQEVEKVHELVHAALRVIVNIEHIPGTTGSPQFATLLNHVQQSPHAALYRSMAEEMEVDT